VDIPRHGVVVDGREVPLTRGEFKLLALLASEPERTFTRAELVRHLWDSEFAGNQRACDAHIVNLRRKIEPDPRRPRYVETVARRGYRFVAAVDVEKADGPVELLPAPPRRRSLRWGFAAVSAITAVVLATGLWPIPVPKVERIVQLTNDGLPKWESPIVESNRVLYTVIVSGGLTEIREVLASGGEPKRVSLPFLQPEVSVWTAG